MRKLEGEELVQLIVAARGGNNEAFERLLENYSPLIASLVSRFPRDDAGEYFSEARIAFYNAVKTYNVEQEGVTFGLYARILISRDLYDLYRKNERARTRLSDSDVDDIAVSDGIVDRLVSEEESEELRAEARALLSDFEYRVFILWLKGYTTADIANEIDKGAKSVDNAKARILKKLRDGLSPRHR